MKKGFDFLIGASNNEVRNKFDTNAKFKYENTLVEWMKYFTFHRVVISKNIKMDWFTKRSLIRSSSISYHFKIQPIKLKN